MFLEAAGLAAAILLQPVISGTGPAHSARPITDSLSRAAILVDTITPNASQSQGAERLKRWAPRIGGTAGAAILGVGVADEEDLVLTGKLMWIGIGAAAGAGAGWLIAKIASRHP